MHFYKLQIEALNRHDWRTFMPPDVMTLGEAVRSLRPGDQIVDVDWYREFYQPQPTGFAVIQICEDLDAWFEVKRENEPELRRVIPKSNIVAVFRSVE